jgi:hypothetical protein
MCGLIELTRLKMCVVVIVKPIGVGNAQAEAVGVNGQVGGFAIGSDGNA